MLFVVDPTPVHLREREPSLYQMPHMWQPNLFFINPNNVSHADLKKGGLYKWGFDYPSMHAHSLRATEPDWHQRRMCEIMDSKRKYFLRKTEGVSKPNQRKFDENWCERQFLNPFVATRSGRHIVPQRLDDHLADFRRYHPENYEFPLRCSRLPPINRVDKNGI